MPERERERERDKERMGKFIGIFERMLLMGIFFGHSVLFSLTAGFFSPGLGGFGFRPSNHCCGGLYRPAQCNCLSLLLFSCLIPTSYRISCPPLAAPLFFLLIVTVAVVVVVVVIVSGLDRQLNIC